MTTLADVRRRALAALRPPPRVRLSDWIEAELRLPEGVSVGRAGPRAPVAIPPRDRGLHWRRAH
jgi:hypothetical protein